MILEESDILEKIENPKPIIDDTLKKNHTKLIMHSHGIGVGEYIKQIEGLENETKIQLRKKLSKSNKNIVADILRPIDKVFKAQGGSKDYLLKDKSKKEEFEDKLSVIYNGQSFAKWLKTYFTDKYVNDPNGIYLVEHKNNNAYPTYKSILTIRDYCQNGIYINYIIFEPEELTEIINNKEQKYQKVRVYDDKQDATYEIRNNKLRIVEEETYPNPWGYVPAVLCSDIVNPITDYKESFLYNQVEVLDEYLRENSVKTLLKYHHGFPLFWMYMSTCPICKGQQQIQQGEETKTCYACNGTGISMKKDVSDVSLIKPPEDNDTPTITPDVAGYVVPPIDSIEMMSTELKLLRDMVYYSRWGVLLDREDVEKTAFEVALNTQPMQDALNDVTNSLDTIEGAIIDIIGEYYYESYEGSSINNGRYYMIMSPEDIMKSYLEHKTQNASQTILNNELKDYYSALYQYDIYKRTIYTKLIQVEPFVHYTIAEVKDFAPKNELDQKIYYLDWLTTVEQEYLFTADIKKLKEDLKLYVEQKLLENGIKTE